MAIHINSHYQGTSSPQSKKLRSTTKIKKSDIKAYEKDMNPIEEKDSLCKLFCYAAPVNDFDDTIYSDAMGKFPVPSYHGNNYVMIIYVY